MKKLITTTVIALMLLGACAHLTPDPNGADARDVMAQSVKVSVSIAGVKLSRGEDGGVVATEQVTGWSGSGVVVAAAASRGGGESLVMSAAHVTNVPPIMVSVDEDENVSLFLVQASMIVVERLDGSGCAAEQVYADIPNDVGVLKASCIAGDVARIAGELPPVGAMVTVSGAGLGVHPNGVFLVEDGRFLGFEDGFDPQMLLSVPVAPGHSGSGVFRNGEVIGIISRRYTRFEHASLAVPLEKVKAALEKSLEIWNGG